MCSIPGEDDNGLGNVRYLRECWSKANRWMRWNTQELKFTSKSYLIMNNTIIYIKAMWIYRWKIKKYCLYTRYVKFLKFCIIKFTYFYAANRLWVLRILATYVALAVSMLFSTKVQMNLQQASILSFVYFLGAGCR
jgi:hypothetical protein